MKLRIHLCCAAVVAMLAGCAAQLPADPSKMSPDQLAAVAKDRSAMASCTVGNGPWGVVRTIYVQVDQKTIPAGGVTVAADCSVTVQSEKVSAKPAPAP